MRHLRDYECVAQREHFCDICCEQISPGEQYIGSVYATKEHMVVFKEHLNPSCDFPPEPDKDDSDSELEREVNDFKEAA